MVHGKEGKVEEVILNASLDDIQLLRKDCQCRDTRKASGFGCGIDIAANLRGYNFKTFGIDSNPKKLQVKLNKFSQEWNVREEEE